MHSLNGRLLVLVSIILAVFLGITGVTLDRAFRESARAAVWDRLQAEIYMLLGAVAVDERGALSVPKVLPDPRLSTPDSGLYARITDADGQALWRSDSMLAAAVEFPTPGDPGIALKVETNAAARKPGFFAMSYAVAWELYDSEVRHFVFAVAETRDAFERQISRFRRSLWSWFVACAVVLLLVQAAILRWGLSPLRRVADEVNRIEAGSQSELAGPYPSELESLTRNLNALIRSSREHLQRYRHALGDLAHSLKTPLAVIRASMNEISLQSPARSAMEEQLSRIDQAINYQLQRAAASGRTALTEPLAVSPIVERIRQSLLKVYADKRIRIETAIDSSTRFRGDAGDLLEICGNLMDNACKWCSREIRVTGDELAASEGRPAAFILEVEDDGPGIADENRNAILQRGVRGDASIHGHGIGLAVVRQLVEEVYRGRMEISRGSGGGALIRVLIPE